MKFMSRQEAAPYRVKYAFERGLAFLEKGDLQRAWLDGNVINRYSPGWIEGPLLWARVNARKAQVLGELIFYLDAGKNYEQVLKIDPRNQEARQALAKIKKMGVSEADLPAWRDKCLGTEPVAFKICQIGYHPRGVKAVVIWTLADYPGGTFRVVERVSGQTVFRGKLKKHGRYAWKRWHWGAEFSGLRREGEYYLEAAFPELKTPEFPGAAGRARSRTFSCSSHPFPVSAGVYTRAMRLSLEGFFNHRCGQDLAYRKACNEGPLRFKDTRQDFLASGEDGLAELPAPIRLKGGWHDGGNWEKHASNMVSNLYCLLLGHQYAPRAWHRYGEKAPDVLVEARYAVDYFLSAYEAFGTAQVSTHVAGAARAPDGRYFLTKVYLSHEDREKIAYVTVFDKTRSTWIPWFARLYAPALAFFALQYRRYDAAYAEKCRALAVKLQAYHRQPDPNEKITQSTAAAIALGDMYLWHLTGENAGRQNAAQAVQAILAIQEADGFFPAAGIEESAMCLAGFYPQIALLEFARLFPESPLRGKIIAAFKAFLPWIEKLSARSPFGHMLEYKKKNPRNVFSGINGHAPNAYYGYAAIICLLAGRLLKTGKYAAIAERQAHWLFGHNPAGICMLGGAGWRNASQHLMDTCDHGREFRHVPGFVPLGIRSLEVKGLGNDYPFFPAYDIDGAGQGLSIFWSTCEGGGMTEGPWQAALALLAREKQPDKP